MIKVCLRSCPRNRAQIPESGTANTMGIEPEEFSRNEFKELWICSKCVKESELEQFISYVNGAPECSFCNGNDAPTCEFIKFADYVKKCLSTEYDLAVDNLGWDKGEGGWQFAKTWDTHGLIIDELGIEFSRDGNRSVLQALLNVLGNHDWCVTNPYGVSPLDELRVGWERFCNLIQHETRFFLDRWAPSVPDVDMGEPEQLTPIELLSAIGTRVQSMQLFRTLPARSIVYRARRCKRNHYLSTPDELGPPPQEKAVLANRMSPPGIVMFYGALDSNTAVSETITKPASCSVGKFVIHRSLNLLDLTCVPSVPSIFAKQQAYQLWSRADAQFFKELVEHLTKPIARDARIHIEYIPTQVVTEYCRLVFHVKHATEKLDGILYLSARQPGGESLVLFADRSAVIGIENETDGRLNDAWLELVDVEDFDL